MVFPGAPQRVYVLALYATRPSGGASADYEHEVYLRVALAVAADEEEAREKVGARLYELCPPEQGWLNHHVALDRIPKESLRRLLAAADEDGPESGAGEEADAPEMLM